MSWWADLFKRRTRAAPDGLAVTDGIVSSGGTRGAARRGTRELLIMYREAPWLRAVVGRIARGVASVEWSVYVRVEEPTSARARTRQKQTPRGEVSDVSGVPSFRWGRDFAVRDHRLLSGNPEQRAARRVELAAAGVLREVSDHPLLEMLAHPNDELTGRSSLQMTQTWVDLKGEAFWLLGGAEKGGPPTGYLALPPHWVTEVPSKDRPFFRISYGALQMQVPASKMVWFRDPDPENPYGRGSGVAEALADELETDEAAAKYVKNWFYNGGLPSAVVAFEGLDKEGIKRAEEKWSQAYSGYQNAHRVHFSGGKMNFAKLDTSFKDQQLIELRKSERDVTVQVFGVPPECVGIIENSNRSTIDGAGYIYALSVEFPRCEFLRSELQAKLAPHFDEAICIECEVKIPDNEARRLEVMAKMPTAFTLNEWREEAGYPEHAELDGQFPAAMPGQAPVGAEPAAAPAAEPDDGEEPGELEAEKSAPRLPGDPPWARALPLRR